MFENKLLDNLTIGILVLDAAFKVKYLNKRMKNILKIEKIDFSKLEVLLKNLNFTFNGKFRVKSSKIQIDKKIFFQLEFHENPETSTNKFVAMLDTIQDFIFYLDSEGKIEYFNKAYENHLGKAYLEIIGEKESKFYPDDMAIKCDQNNEIALKLGNFYEEEYFYGKWYQTFKSRVNLGNNEYGIFGMVKDITDSKKKVIDLSEKVYKDALTGIYNRNFYEEKITDIFKNKKEQIYSMLLIDIDKFKNINDFNGHDVGDWVLKRLCNILKRNVRQSNDFIIRLGGDEILIIIEGEKDNLEKILNAIEKDILLENSSNDLKFTISIGIGERKKCETLDSLYKRVDVELYKNKNRGK